MSVLKTIRPYVAVLKDSFREALVSRVLWIALIGILLLLAALAPFGLRKERSMKLRQQEVADPEEFVRALEAGSREEGTPAAHLWKLLNEDQRNRVTAWKQPPAAPAPPDRRSSSLPRQIVKLFNDLIPRKDFYDAASWSTIQSSEATQQLIAESTNDETRIPFRNLALLSEAFAGSIKLQEDPALTLVYATTEVFGPIDTMFAEFQKYLDQIVIAVLSVFLGFFGLFGSLLVSASIIPRTYEPGEISLLLSKPVGRSLLFITKFVGGCIFTLLCVSVLVVGVWLLLGFRLHFWRIEMLWCIPIYVFLFAVYFSVSALAGVIWRNSVVSLILATMFWVVLFVVGTTRGLINENVFKSKRITEITVAGGDVFIVDGSYAIRRWNADASSWQEVLIPHGQRLPGMVRRMMFSGSRLRPVYDFAGERILALQPEPSRFGAGASTLISGSADGNWEREPEGLTPEPALTMAMDSTGRVILASRRGIYQFLGQSDEQKKAQKYFGGVLSGLLRTPAKEAFPQRQSGNLPTWSQNAVVVMHPSTDALFVLSDGVLHRLDRQADGNWASGDQRPMPSNSPAVMAAAGQSVLIAFENREVLVLNPQTLKTTTEHKLPEDWIPRVADAAADGSRLALLSHDGRVLIYDGKTAAFSDWEPREQGAASAIAFDAEQRLLVADGRRMVSFYKNGAALPEKQVGVPGDWVCILYDYIITPMYRILPRPSELDQVVTYLVTGQKYITVSANEGGPFAPPSRAGNLQQERVRIDLWSPIYSNCLFIAVMLVAGCVYVARRDF
jgi:ABC-type transport system involved in multi-copper enzyme maturation permease subunit